MVERIGSVRTTGDLPLRDGAGAPSGSCRTLDRQVDDGTGGCGASNGLFRAVFRIV
jgi:hypothetical protein